MGSSNFLQIGSGLDVMPLLYQVQSQPGLWNRNLARLAGPQSPHRETSDIWLRYKDEAENVESGDYSNFGDPHDPIWYPAFYALPAARSLIFGLMAAVEGERLGGVLLYNVPAHKQIYTHTDQGWHVQYYDKFNICLQSNPRAGFCYSDGSAMVAQPGDVHFFRNDIPHWVMNEGDADHIILTVCIRTHKYRGSNA